MVIKTFILSLTISLFLFTSSVFAQETNCEDGLPPEYCAQMDQLDDALSEEPENFTLIEDILIEMLYYIAVNWRGNWLPITMYLEEGNLDLLIENGMFPESMSSYVTSAMLEEVRIRAANALSTEIDAYENGIDSVSDMADYLGDIGILSKLLMLKITAKSRMNKMNLTPSYLPPQNFTNNSELPVIESFPAEFEGTNAVIVAWPTYNAKLWITEAKFIKAITQAGTTPYILVDDANIHRAALLTLRALFGANMSDDDTNTKIKFLYLPTDWWWMRDSTPSIVLDENGSSVFVSSAYDMPWLPPFPNNSLLNDELESYLGIPNYTITDEYPNYVDEGGNLLSDGNGTVFIEESVFERNEYLTISELEEIASLYWGADRVVTLPRVSGEMVGHIDSIMKVVDPYTVVIADASDTLYADMAEGLDALAALMAETNSDAGNGPFYNVYRIPVPLSTQMDLLGLTQHSYVNSLIVNDTVVMTGYNILQDGTAKGVYEDLGFNVIKVDATNLMDGGFHCLSKEIP